MKSLRASSALIHLANGTQVDGIVVVHRSGAGIHERLVAVIDIATGKIVDANERTRTEFTPENGCFEVKREMP